MLLQKQNIAIKHLIVKKVICSATQYLKKIEKQHTPFNEVTDKVIN